MVAPVKEIPPSVAELLRHGRRRRGGQGRPPHQDCANIAISARSSSRLAVAQVPKPVDSPPLAAVLQDFWDALLAVGIFLRRWGRKDELQFAVEPFIEDPGVVRLGAFLGLVPAKRDNDAVAGLSLDVPCLPCLLQYVLSLRDAGVGPDASGSRRRSDPQGLRRRASQHRPRFVQAIVIVAHAP